MICNKHFLTFLFTLLTFSCVPVFAAHKASVRYDESRIDYSVLNSQVILQEADDYFDKFEQTNEPKYLTTAMAKYYILTRINPLDLYSTVQLARTYDYKKADKYAKEYFNIGLDIDKNDAYLNYYFGDFYFTRTDYKRALRYYKKAYNNGYGDNYDLNIKIATIYEKFADLLNAKYYYGKANSIKQTESVTNKINDITQLNYDKSEYYGSSKK